MFKTQPIIIRPKYGLHFVQPAEEDIVATEGAEMLVETSEPLKAATGTETSVVCSSPESAVTKVGFNGPGDTSEHRSEHGGLRATSSGQVDEHLSESVSILLER